MELITRGFVAIAVMTPHNAKLGVANMILENGVEVYDICGQPICCLFHDCDGSCCGEEKEDD